MTMGILALLALPALAGDPLAHEGLGAEVWQALSSRHEVGCEHILALGPRDEVQALLIEYAEARMPPAAPVRAASCVALLAADDDEALRVSRAWMDDPRVPGMALAVVERLDALPEARAVDLARRAATRAEREPRFQRMAAPHLGNSRFEAVRRAWAERHEAEAAE